MKKLKFDDLVPGKKYLDGNNYDVFYFVGLRNECIAEFRDEYGNTVYMSKSEVAYDLREC